MEQILQTISRLWQTSGFYMLGADWRQIVMIVIACGLLYLGLVRKFEPLLLVGIAFGMLLTNLPGSEMYHPELWDAYIAGEIRLTDIVHDGGLLDILYIGVKSGLYPSLIFLGVGAMTDFGPLGLRPSSAFSPRSCWPSACSASRRRWRPPSGSSAGRTAPPPSG